MALSEEARERLADVVELQPTKNGELADRWGMDGGSEVHGYLESELGEYYYRDDNSLIRATDDAADLVDVEPGVTGGPDSAVESIRVPRLQSQVFEVVAGPDDRSDSVVAVVHKLRDAFDVDPSTDAVRDALNALRRKDVVAVEYRTVPTYRLSVERDAVDVSVTDE